MWGTGLGGCWSYPNTHHDIVGTVRSPPHVMHVLTAPLSCWTARDLWKKRYFEEKKKTSPLEEKAEKLRSELDALHRRIMSHLEIQKDREEKRNLQNSKPSVQVTTKNIHRFLVVLDPVRVEVFDVSFWMFRYESIFLQNNLKIQATKLQHDIMDLERRTDNVKMKLTAEMKVCQTFFVISSMPVQFKRFLNFVSAMDLWDQLINCAHMLAEFFKLPVVQIAAPPPSGKFICMGDADLTQKCFYLRCELRIFWGWTPPPL